MSTLRHRRAERIRDLADIGKTRREIADELFLSYPTVVNYGRQFGIKFRHASQGVGVDEDRADAMAAMFRAGRTLEDIGTVYNVTRERVRQIIAKYRSLIGRDGGQTVRAKIERERRRAEREAECYRVNGCSMAQLRELRRIGKGMRSGGETVYRTPIGAFRSQRNNAISRGIDWRLKLWEWWSIWQQSGKWNERGRAANAFVMCRFRDDGPYQIGNVYIATLRHNSTIQPNNPYRTTHPYHDQAARRISAAARKSGVRTKHFGLPCGVTRNREKYVAQITVGGVHRYLGSFGCPNEAHSAYRRAVDDIFARQSSQTEAA